MSDYEIIFKTPKEKIRFSDVDEQFIKKAIEWCVKFGVAYGEELRIKEAAKLGLVDPASGKLRGDE